MGTRGYERAAQVQYRPGEVILEIGSGESTHWMARHCPDRRIYSVDPKFDQRLSGLPVNVRLLTHFAEEALKDWDEPIGFAWLDGWDYPYTSVDYPQQRAEYELYGQEFSQAASMRSHLDIARNIAGHARVIAFDDTWRTHHFLNGEWRLDACLVTCPPATTPAPALAMDTPFHRDVCGLSADHPHHTDPDRGWAGKGGTAIPWLLDHGYTCTHYALGLVVLEKENA